MGILNFRNKKKQSVEERGIDMGGLMFNSLSTFTSSQSMRLSAVYAATNQISNSCALLPINIVKVEGQSKKQIEHKLYQVLNFKPDKVHTHYNWMKTMIESVMLTGNGYALIERDENLDVVNIRYIQSDYVTPMILGDGTVKYMVSGLSKAVDASDMIHLYQHCDERLNGLSVIKYASQTLKSSNEAEKHSENFFKSGANLSGIIKASATLTNEQKKQIKESWNSAFSTNTETSSVAVLPAGLEYQAISVSPEDSQLLESRKYNVIEIARFFNISPMKLFDYSNSSFGSLEQTQLSYLQDTIYPYVRMMVDEFNVKLFKPSEVGKYQVDFDFSSLMAADKKTEADYYKELLCNGILSLNEVRAKMGYAPTEDGDKHYMQLSFASLDLINSGQLTNKQDQTQLVGDEQLDNKVTNKKAKKNKE